MAKIANGFTAAEPPVSGVEKELSSVPPISLDSLPGSDTQGKQQPHEITDYSSNQQNLIAKPHTTRKFVSANTSRVQAFLRTSAGQDAALASIEYLAHALHYLLKRRHLRTTHGILSYLLRSRRADRHSIVGDTLHNNEQHSRLLKLSSLLSNTRCTVRLLGLLSIWADVPNLLQCSPKDYIVFGINVVQVFTITAYQLLENIGHLTSNGVLSARLIGPRSKIMRFYVWGARALLLHFALELLRLSKEAWQTRKNAHDNQISGNAKSKPENDSMESGKENSALEMQNWRESLWSTSIWGILCLYWSSGRTIPLVDETSGGLSFLADFFAFRKLWSQTKA